MQKEASAFPTTHQTGHEGLLFKGVSPQRLKMLVSFSNTQVLEKKKNVPRHTKKWGLRAQTSVQDYCPETIPQK